MERQNEAAAADSRNAPEGLNACMALRVERRTTLPGEVTLEASADHRVKVHIGDPVRGACSIQRFVYEPGHVDILPAGTSDCWREEGSSTSLFLRFTPALLARAAQDMGLDPCRVGLDPQHQFRDAQIEHIARALDAEQAAGHPSGRLYTDSLALALAVRLLGHYKLPGHLPRGLSAAQRRRVTDYIEAHIDDSLTLETLAAVANLSASHLKTLFKASTGVPVHEYVIQRRVARAKALLIAGHLPASQIALEAGFAHQSHMARCMRRVLGVTPSALARGEPA